MKPDLEHQAAARLAYRAEGENWNVYIAPLGTMNGALLVGSIKMAFVTDNDSCKQLFMDAFESAILELHTRAGLTVERMVTQEAPEHERSGNA